MMFKKIMISILIFISTLAFTSCAQKNEEYIEKSDFLLDTIVNIKIYNAPKEDEKIIDEVFTYIQELEDILSVHVEGSDIYNLNENAGIKPVKVTDYTMEVVKRSLFYSQKTGGKLDVTAGPLIDLWRIDPPDGYVPTADEIVTAQGSIDYTKIEVDEKNQTIMLKETGTRVNLGAIAKGYIADQVKEFLLEKGVEHGIINLGGNVLLIGSKNGTDDFRIGVQDPDSDRGAYLGVVSVKDCTVVSSGDYERYFISNGKKYHHILDPSTGYPADTGLRQTTIITPKSVDGDGLSTSTFLLGADKAMELIESLPEAEAIFVTADHKIYVTSGLKDVFEFDADNYGDVYQVIYK